MVYFGVGLRLWWIQDHEIFKPMPTVARTPADLKPPLKFESVELAVGDSAVHGYWVPRDNAAAVVLFLHGQDTTLGKNLQHVETLHALGFHVLLIDYRGFGATFGQFTPSEASVYEDVERVWRDLIQTRGFTPTQIVIYGHSLGGAIAIELATRYPSAAGLIVENSFTSVKDMVHWKMPFTRLYPLGWILRHPLNSLQKVKNQALPPTLFIHGTEDAKVPYFMSQTLQAASPGSTAELLLVEGGGHAQRGPGQAAYLAAVEQFLEAVTMPASDSPPTRADSPGE
jgi:pimeloyl-ACP methyl ester carboxylesterase